MRKKRHLIAHLLDKYATKYGVEVLAFANVGNHLHLHCKLGNRFAYPAFIRALTGAIALAVTGANKFKKLAKRFWDRRPFTRIVRGRAAYRRVQDYVGINLLQGAGWAREQAEFVVRAAAGP